MKANRLRWFLLFLALGVVFQLPAQQSEADRKLLADLRAKAEQGDVYSQFELGNIFYSGNSLVAKDYGEAVKWFRKAADQDLSGAQYNLGVCYGSGHGLTKNPVEAVKWYLKAAELNFAQAQHNLAFCYQHGLGVAKDESEALKWYRRAANLGHAPAQCNLGLCYDNGQGVAKDYVEAAKWYRRAAEQNMPQAQYNLGVSYDNGHGVAKDMTEAAKWLRKAAEQNLAEAQFNLGTCYLHGEGVIKDESEAVRWFRKAADQNYAPAQFNLGICYSKGDGVLKNDAEALKWCRRAAEQNDSTAQRCLGLLYGVGQGAVKDYVEGYKWELLAAAQGDERGKLDVAKLESLMTPEQIADGQKLARNFRPREVPSSGDDTSAEGILQTRPESSGTGFFITDDGYLITNEHVAGNGAQVRLVTSAGLISARVVKVDSANDFALLKADGKFTSLPIASSRTMRMGGTVATVGFPNIGLQGFAPKLAKGEIAALSGAQDDPRYFQISVPVQPGNSGGALVDERGNVVGVVAAKLSMKAALATGGALPENVNYAVKSSLLLSFLESMPDVAAKLKDPGTKECRFEDVVKSAEKAAVLVLVY